MMLRWACVGLLAVAVVLLLCLQGRHTGVQVRAADGSDAIADRYFLISNEGAAIRNIVVLTGLLAEGDVLTFHLFLVRHREAEVIGGITIASSAQASGVGLARRMSLTLALGSWNADQGVVTVLGCAGQVRASGSAVEVAAEIVTRFSDTCVGPIVRGQEALIYAEGDAEVHMSSGMTISGFAGVNAGSYYAVTAKLERAS